MQGNTRKQRMQAEDWLRTKADVPTLPQEHKRRMNQTLIDMYLDDFASDMRKLLFFLKKLEIENEKLIEYQQVLLDCEIRNVRKTFSK